MSLIDFLRSNKLVLVFCFFIRAPAEATTMSQPRISPNIKHRHHCFSGSSCKINSFISELILFHSSDCLEIHGTLCFVFSHLAVKEIKDFPVSVQKGQRSHGA